MRQLSGKRYNPKFTILISLLIIFNLSACSTLSDFLEQSPNTPPPLATPTTPANINETGNMSGGMQPDGMTVDEASLMPPLEPLNVNASLSDGSAEIQWQGTGLDIGVHYVLYRRIAGQEVWQIIATVPVEGDNRGSYTYQDTTIETNTSYEYALSIVDSFNNESRLSPVMTVNTN